MTDAPDTEPRKDPPKPGNVDREEQGDLLAEAVTGLFSGTNTTESEGPDPGEGRRDPRQHAPRGAAEGRHRPGSGGIG